MEQYEFGAAATWERIVALQREAIQARLAKSRRPAAASPGRGGMTMLTEHQHKPGEFDPATARTVPTRPACWTTTGMCNARSEPSRTSTGGPATPPAGHRGHVAAGIGILLTVLGLLID